MESWEINPFLDAPSFRIHTIALDFLSIQTSTLSLRVIYLWIHIHIWCFPRPEILRKKKAQQINKHVVFSMCTCELAAISHFSHDLSLVFPLVTFLHTFNMCWVLSQKMLLFNELSNLFFENSELFGLVWTGQRTESMRTNLKTVIPERGSPQRNKQMFLWTRKMVI